MYQLSRLILHGISSQYHNTSHNCKTAMRIQFGGEPLRIGLHDGRWVTVGGHRGFPLNVCSHLKPLCYVPYSIHYVSNKITVTSNPYRLNNIFIVSEILESLIVYCLDWPMVSDGKYRGYLFGNIAKTAICLDCCIKSATVEVHIITHSILTRV